MHEPPYELIAEGLRAGDVVPFFGASASAICRPDGELWCPGKSFMPFGSELAAALANSAKYPVAEAAFRAALADVETTIQTLAPNVSAGEIRQVLEPVLRAHIDDVPALALVASWTEHFQADRRALDRKLRQWFAIDGPPGLLQTRLASVNGTRLYVTTNYDNLVEKALEARQPHLIIDKGDKGLWVSVAGGSMQRVSAIGTDLYDLLDDPNTQQPSHPIIFKMHGSVDMADPRNDSFLITEEDYVDFLGRPGGSYLPPYVNGLMQGKNFLFLGYSLADWNVRVILRKLRLPMKSTPAGNASKGRNKINREMQSQGSRFWAIVRGRSDTEQEVGRAHGLNIYNLDLRVFAEELTKWL